MAPTFPTILRLSSFLSIILGLLALLGYSILPAATAGAFHFVSPDEALGLVFLGFAVRMWRLDAKSPLMRSVHRASRIFLIVVGLFLMLGMSLVGWAGLRDLNGAAGFAAGLTYVFAGVSLIFLRREDGRKGIYAAGAGAIYVGLCWVAGLLQLVGLAPLPFVLDIGWIPGILATAVLVSLSSMGPDSGEEDAAGGNKSGAGAARKLVPIAFILPLFLAVLRHKAESAGYLHPQYGLLLHVVISVIVIGLLLAWNGERIDTALRTRQAAVAAYEESEKLFRELLGAIEQPVWILDARSNVIFANPASDRMASTDARLAGALGQAQQKELVTGAMVGRAVHSLHVYDTIRKQERRIPVAYLRLLQPEPSQPGEVRVLVVAGTEEVEAPPVNNDAIAPSLQSLSESMAGIPYPGKNAAAASSRSRG